MGNYDFVKDLSLATTTQTEVADILQDVYGFEILGFDNTNKYDILAKYKRREYTFEVKEDFMSEDTGNVALEFSCRGKPSGIETSRADFYIYKLHRKNGVEFVLHTSKTLKDMVKKALYHRIVNGGDPGSNSLNYLFSYAIFVKHGTMLSKTHP